MILELRQTRKELYSAEFVVLRSAQEAGAVQVEGKFGHREAVIRGSLYDAAFELRYGKSSAIRSKAFRPYKISIDGIETGVVYQTEEKTGPFKSRIFHQMVRNGRTLERYAVALAGERTKYPIYCGSEQVALAESDRTIYNDLFHYRIYAPDADSSLTALLFCLYMYINACYKPGKKAIRSVATGAFVTTDPVLLDKYDPHFQDTIQA
ncbi:MAG: hypothetical protein LUD83_06750 [Clostridiales bacterium]|nr:hypothetical protein [Clostridiales bacterium]